MSTSSLARTVPSTLGAPATYRNASLNTVDQRAQILPAIIQVARVIHGTCSLRSAAALFDSALELIDQGRNSKLWACLQQCLGIAFQEIAKAEKEMASLEQSETCFSKSLTILNNNAFPLDWASVQYELGLTHVIKSSMGVDGASERAMEFFDSACTVFRRQEQPRKWALAQNGIACAHRESLPIGDIPRLEKAISLHLEAMDELTPAAFPQDRADVEFDLAVTRKRLGAIKGDSEQQALASRNFANVLNFYTASLFPYQWTQIASEADMSGRLAST